MSFKFYYVNAAGMSLAATLERQSDGKRWNPTAVAWQTAPSFNDSKIMLTEGSAQNAGSYSATVTGLGNDGHVVVRVHNLSSANVTIAISEAFISAGAEPPPTASGAGGTEVEITVKNDEGDPVPDCSVWITTDEQGALVVAGTLRTGDDGKVTFNLDSGASYFVWRNSATVNFDNPATISVP